MTPTWRIHTGDVLDVLRTMADESVQMCMTSPPYWGLRDYGTAEWEGGDIQCDHKAPTHQGTTGQRANRTFTANQPYREICGKCGAHRIDSPLGLEPTPEAYVAKMVEVFREVRRVLRRDGTLWLNMGDKSANKQLLGIPWRVALALQADGWWLRSAMPWVKRSAMPESCTDRPWSSLEYVFLLTRKARYYFDMDAVRKPCDAPVVTERRSGIRSSDLATFGLTRGTGNPSCSNPAGRGFRNTDFFYQSTEPPYGMIFAGDEPVGLDVNPQGFAGKHFAAYPFKLVDPCIKAGTSERGCCAECGAPWKRVVESGRRPTRPARDNVLDETGIANRDPKRHVTTKTTTGWQPGCECSAEPVPCLVLDPFLGAGTTTIVALRLGRSCVGIELSPEYVAMARKRIIDDAPLFNAGAEVQA